jgi:hypothetical protein
VCRALFAEWLRAGSRSSVSSLPAEVLLSYAGRTSLYSLNEIDTWLDEMSHETTEAGQSVKLDQLLRRATPDDLRFAVRLLWADLQIGAGAKNILSALHPSAYSSWCVAWL